MIQPNELSQMKSRLMLAGDAARKIIESPSVVYYDADTYWPVRVSLLSLTDDLTQVLTELDILRAMFHERMQEFLGGNHEGRDDVNHAGELQGRGVGLPGVALATESERGADHSTGPGAGPIAAGTDGGSQAGGIPVAPSGAKPRRNRKSRKPAAEPVVPTDAAESVGGESQDS